MTNLVGRIVTRFKQAEALDIVPLIAGFRRALDQADNKWAELDAAKDDSMTPIRAMVYLPGFFEVAQKYGHAHQIFWGLLQQYKITSTSDRKLIEQASKEFSKSRIQKPKREMAMSVLKSKLDLYRQYLDAAERIVKKGELHADENSGTTEKAGCFTLVNTGGFSPEQMEDVSKVVEKASSLIKAKGFGKLCYGTIQVTNTIKSGVLAFYVLKTDEMFVRANLKGQQGPAIHTFIHELGHRLQEKFLHSQNHQIKSLYNALLNGENLASRELLDDKSKWPKPGDTIEQKGQTLIVDRVGLNRTNDYTVFMHVKDEPKFVFTISLVGWLAKKGFKKKQTFVSPYARTDPDENFAEMFGHYVLDTLPDGQVQMLEAIIK